MIELGKVQELVIIRTKEFGVYLAEKEGDEAAVLLPKKQVPEGAGIGDKVEVFIYKDSSDRLIATTGKPKLQVGETAKLEVKDVAKIGAFLDMGLEKDLLLPFKEQTHPVRKGEQCLVTLYVDKSRRLAATMRVYSHMSNQSPYKAEDWVTGTIYEINEPSAPLWRWTTNITDLFQKRSYTAGSGRGIRSRPGLPGCARTESWICASGKNPMCRWGLTKRRY